MARSLMRAGFPLIVYNRTRAHAAALRDDGATVAETPAELAGGADVVITMLADGDAVLQVTLGEDGILAGARPGTVLIDMSTIGPDGARQLARAAAQLDISVLDAPVSGSLHLAEAGELTTVVGGDRAVFERVLPVLSAMTRAQAWLGPSGAGAAMKLALNGIVAATTHALSEALVVAERSGLDRAAAYDAIASSAVRSPFVDYKREAFLSPGGEPAAFTLALMQKDIDLYLRLGRDLKVPLLSASASDQMLTLARASAGDDADLAGVADALRSLSGDGSETGDARDEAGA